VDFSLANYFNPLQRSRLHPPNISTLSKEDSLHFGGTSKEKLMLNDQCNQQISQLSKNGRQHGKYNPRVEILTSTITNLISEAVTKAQAAKIGRQK